MATTICSKAPCLRAVAQTARTFSAAPPTAPFSSSARPLKQLRLSVEIPAPRCSIASIIPAIRFSSPASQPGRRNVSTTATGASSTGEPPANVLTWDRFFDLRRKRRFINLAASVASAMVTVGVAAPLIASNDIDAWGAQVSGMDPFVVLGVTTMAVAGAGWLCGPAFGSAGFGMWAGRRGWKTAISEKEKSFYARIKRYRADPSASSPQNPVPDYYGEKIASVRDYRRWLKDQRAFNRKRNKGIEI